MSNFRDYVTGQSFALTLSRRMIDMLCQMDQFGATFGMISTARSLEERGLCEWNPASESERSNFEFRRYVLTDAGRAVMPLLKLAGIYIEYPKNEPEVIFEKPIVRIKGAKPCSPTS